MTGLFLGLAVLLVTAASTGCRREAAASSGGASAAQSAATRTVAVPVDGMICQVCAGGVKSALKEVPGVQNVEVSLEKRSAVIRYEDGRVTFDQLTRAITDLGLKAGVPTPVQQ
jgi:mercuric ion binding protein